MQYLGYNRILPHPYKNSDKFIEKKKQYPSLVVPAFIGIVYKNKSS